LHLLNWNFWQEQQNTFQWIIQEVRKYQINEKLNSHATTFWNITLDVFNMSPECNRTDLPNYYKIMKCMDQATAQKMRSEWINTWPNGHRLIMVIFHFAHHKYSIFSHSNQSPVDLIPVFQWFWHCWKHLWKHCILKSTTVFCNFSLTEIKFFF
jgi:hypothetical protein